MTAAATSEVHRWLKAAHDDGDVSSLRKAFSILKTARTRERAPAIPADGVSSEATVSSSAETAALPSSAFISCCEEAIALEQWDVAAECVRYFQSEPKATKAMQARALYCEGVVRSRTMDAGLGRSESTDERLACAASVLAGLGIAIEEWPRSAEVVVHGLEQLWSIVGVLFHAGHHESVVEVIGFVLSLHERLMIGGAQSHLLWTTRYAVALRGAGRLAEAVAQWNAALETALRRRDERLQVQILRALTVALSEREVAVAATGAKTAKSEVLTVPRTASGMAIHFTQLFLSGYYHTGAGALSGLAQARSDLRMVLDRLEGAEPSPGSVPVAAGKGGGSSGGRAVAAAAAAATAGGGGSGAGAAAAGSRAGRQAPSHASQQQTHGSGSGSAANALEGELSSTELLDEVLSDVLLCLALVGSEPGDAPESQLRESAAVARLLGSGNMRARTFALYAKAMRQPGCDAEALRKLATAPDTSHLSNETRTALLRCLKNVESAMGGSRAIANASERDYAVHMGCSLLWSVMQPLLLPPGKSFRSADAQEQQQLRRCLVSMADDLTNCEATLPVLQTAIEYQCSVLELDADNISQARRRVMAALRRLPLDGFAKSTSPPIVTAPPPRNGMVVHSQSLSAASGAGGNAFASSPTAGTGSASISGGLGGGPSAAFMGASSGGAAVGEASAVPLPMDFPLAWLRHRIDVRAALDGSTLADPADQALHLIEQAMCASTQTKYVSLLKTAFSKLPPLVAVAPPESSGTASVPPQSAAEKSSHAVRGKSRQSSIKSARRDDGGKKVASAMAASVFGPTPRQALPDRSLAQLYAALLRQCCADGPVPEPLVPIAAATAEALLNVPLEVTEQTYLAGGPAEDTHRVLELTAMQGEAALFLSSVAPSAAHEAGERDTGTPGKRTFTECVVRAAEIGWLLCENREPGAWLCLNACEQFLDWRRAEFDRGHFGDVTDPLERLYGFYHCLPPRAVENENQLTVDIGVSLVLALLHDYVKGKGECNGELGSGSFEEFFAKVLRYPRGDASSVLLKKALEVATLTQQAVADVSVKAHLCMLMPPLQRLNMMSSSSNANGNSSGGPSAQESLLLLMGRACNPAMSVEEKKTLIGQDAMRLLKAGPPTVQLCGRLALLAQELALEGTVLELCDMATSLYKDGKLGWWTLPERGDSAAAPSATATSSPLTGPGAVVTANQNAPDRKEQPAKECVKKPCPEDWYWYASLLLAQASVLSTRCSVMEGDSAVRIGVQILMLCTNSAIAAARGPITARKRVVAAAYQLFYSTLYLLWPRSLRERHLLIPSLRMMLSEHVLDPALVAFHASRRNKPSRKAALSPSDAAAREHFYQLLFNMGLALVRCFAGGVGGAAGARSDGDENTTVATLQTANEALSFLRFSLPSKWQRELTAAEVGNVGGLGLSGEAMAKKLKGCDLETESLAWCARARLVTKSRLAALEAWSKALSLSDADPKMAAAAGNASLTGSADAALEDSAASPAFESQRLWVRARTLLEMTQHLASHGWISFGDTVRTLHLALSLLEDGGEGQGGCPLEDAGVTAAVGAQASGRGTQTGRSKVTTALLESTIANRSSRFLSTVHTEKEAVGALSPAATLTKTQGAPASVRPGSRKRMAAGRELTESTLTARELLLAFAIVSTLWAVAPSQRMRRHGGAKVEGRKGAGGLDWYTKRDYALLMVHYVECLWQLCAQRVEHEQSGPQGSDTELAEASSPLDPSVVTLPSRSASWFGFVASDAFLAAVGRRELVSSKDNTHALHGALVDLARYLAQEPGLEHHTFVVTSWCQFAAALRAGPHRHDIRRMSLFRTTNLYAYMAAVRCGAGPAAHIYHVRPADPSFWHGVWDAFAPSASTTAAPPSQTPESGTSPAQQRFSATCDGLLLETHSASLEGLLLAEARCLAELGRCEEADTLVDVVRRRCSSDATAGDASTATACVLHDIRALLQSSGPGSAASALVKMDAWEVTEGGCSDGPLARCVPRLRLEWMELKCRLLVAQRDWEALSRFLATVASMSNQASFEDPSPGELAEAGVAQSTAYLLAKDAWEDIHRVCLVALDEHLDCVTGDDTACDASRAAAEALARQCTDVLCDGTGAFSPSLAARMTAVASIVRRRERTVSARVRRAAHANATDAVKSIGEILALLRDEADRIDAALRTVAAEAALYSGGIGALNGGAAAAVAGAEEGVRRETGHVLATIEVPIQSTMAIAESALTVWKAQNAWSRIVAAEQIQRLYRSLSLPALGLPGGGGPAHLERCVADFMRDPTRVPCRRVEDDTGNDLAVPESGVVEKLRLANEWEQPVAEHPVELVNAFHHFSLPMQLLEGTSRFTSRAALFAAADRVSRNVSPVHADTHAALAGLDYERALELQCGSCSSFPRVVGEQLRRLWAQQPLAAFEQAPLRGGNRHKSVHGAGGGERRANTKKEPETGAVSQTQGSAAQQLSEDQRFALTCALTALRDARHRLDFGRAFEMLMLLANMFTLCGQPTYAATAAELAIGARLAHEVLHVFAPSVGDTAEGRLWRQFSRMATGSFPVSWESSGLDLVPSVEFQRLRAELLASSPMLHRLDALLCVELLSTDETRVAVQGDASLTAATNIPTRFAGPTAPSTGAAPSGARNQPTASSLPAALPESTACLSIVLAMPPASPPPDGEDTTYDFIVVLHHPNGTVDNRMKSLSRSTIHTNVSDFEQLTRSQKAHLAEVGGKRKETEGDGKTGPAPCASSAAVGGSAAQSRVTEAFLNALAGMWERLDAEIVIPLLGEFGDLLAFYGSKQPLYLCLDPLLQPLPIEHAPFLGSRVGVVTRTFSAFGLLLEVGGGVVSGGQRRPRTKGGNATAGGGGVGGGVGGGHTLYIIDPLGEHRDSVEGILGADGGAKQQRLVSGSGSAHLVTAGGVGLAVSQAALSHALQQLTASTVVLSACGTLGGVVPPRTFASTVLDHIHAMLIATCAVNQLSAQREARGCLTSACEGSAVDPSAAREWVLPLLLTARGVRCVSSLWYPLAPEESDALCKRSLPGLLAGKGFADLPLGSAASGGGRASISSVSRTGTSGQRKYTVAIHFGVRPTGATKGK